MMKSEQYWEHIERTFNAFCKIVLYCNLRRTAATGAFASGHPAEPNGHLH